MAAAPEAVLPITQGRPIVIVGCGPVGVRVATEIERRACGVPLVLYGAEAEEPYNRVQLTALLAGEIRWEAWSTDCALPASDMIERRLGCAVTAIDRDTCTIRDECGGVQPYSVLVLAIGSTPLIPNIPGIGRAGVYTFRDMHDAQTLFARRMRSRRTVVIGGGLLGLEAARAMRRFNTEVTVVEHAPRLMPRQLDDEASDLLKQHLRELGLEVRLGVGVREIRGEGRVEGVLLMDDSLIQCDTIVVAAGIRPNVDIARRAGLAIGQGIRVDDRMRTSDPHIYAAGECAEHRGIVHGLLAPGFEQAAVVAGNIYGEAALYRGSLAATRLKVLDLPVFSIGRVVDNDLAPHARQYAFRGQAVYCKIAVERRRIVGAVALGACAQLGRLQEAVMRARVLRPWQRWRFVKTGELRVERQAQHVSRWPAQATVCNCTGVTRGALGHALMQGATTAAALTAATGAGGVCGSCRPLLAELCGAREAPAPVPAWRSLLTLTVLGALIAVLLMQPLDLDYVRSVDAWPAFDVLWRMSVWKQVSGYSVLGLSVVALFMSLRKRIRRFAFGEFSGWRIVHLACGIAALVALFVHTGGRLGAQLDAALMSCFLALALAGTAASAALSLQHRIHSDAVRLRSRLTWVHILLFWPVPLLLGLHIFKSYYY